MSQDMDAEAILRMPSDIDELEKEKAIESIVLETTAEEDCRDNFDESDPLIGSNSSATVPNSLYDAKESLKNTETENGSEPIEMKENESDLLDNTNVDSSKFESESSAVIRESSQTSPQQALSQVSSPKQLTGTNVPTSPTANKILYVKFIPKISTSSTPPSPPKSISISSFKSKPIEIKKVSPVKIAMEEATTSNVNAGRPSMPIGHTVNLLNNNRILIKSVKNHGNSSQATTKTPPIEGLMNSPQIHTDRDVVEQQANDPSEMSVAANVKPADEFVHSDGDDEKCTLEASNGDIQHNISELEIKREQVLNENSSEHIADDCKLSDTLNDDKNLLSAQKIKSEFEQLQKTVNESKVLSEFVIDHKRNRRPTKTGKSKHKYNNSTAMVISSVDDKMSPHLNRSVSPSSSSVRSVSKESDRSATSSFNSSAAKRNTRSMNTDFSAKQKKFLKGIQQVTRGTDDETDNNSGVDDDDDDLDYFAKQQPNITERRKSTIVNKQFSPEPKTGWDKYCWRCHQHDTNLLCSCCIRSYHTNCLKMKLLSPSEMGKWQCPECIEIRTAEKENKKKKFDVKHFNKLLRYAINRILQDPNLQQFQFPVSKTQNPGYSDVIVNPMNLSKIESNIDNLMYTNSEAFLSDIKWILHNCSIYFSDNYKVTRAAKSLQKVSKQEVGDIETCPECYLNANTMTDNWFTETCVKPHLILWAKLKGFPYWPAKAMSINSTLVDVRFFGEHDRANIPSKDCYLYSREDPNPPTNKYKRNTIADCVKEVDVYVENIIAKYGSFNYAELKTPFNPQTAEQHLLEMIPGLRSARGRRRSSTVRSDLTLKIVKTADNHLSVVKKDQTAKELPQIKRTIDITGDGAVSRTPTPPSAVMARRKTSDTRTKRRKSTNRHSDGKLSTLDHKSYQALRRKSMAVEKLDQKRISAIHPNVDLNSTSESSDMSFIRYNAKPSNEKTGTDLISIAPTKKANKNSTKKRKLSADQTKTAEANDVPEKSVRLDNARVTILADDRSEDRFEGNILSSVGLVKKTETATPNTRPTASSSKISNTGPTVQNKNSTCDTDEINRGAARTRCEPVDRVGNHDEGSSLLLLPFVEVKNEPDTEQPANTEEQTPAQTPIYVLSSNENTPAKMYTNIEDNLTNIKTETSSDDDSLMIIEDDVPTTTNTSSKQLSSVEQMLGKLRGSISVKDINKMTQVQQQNARKSFPKGPLNSSASILKPRNNPALAKPAPMNQTNMVCIPLDGLPRLDLNYNSSQPPPLSVVGSANSVSLLTQNQSVQSSTSSTTTSAPTSNLSNGPPPLSITTIPTVVNVNQSSLLNQNAINTISNGMITEQMASAVTDQIIRRNPPQLSARPAAPLRAGGDTVFPTEAGSVCKTLIENSHKMADFFRSVIEDTLGDLVSMDNKEAKIRLLECELEKSKNTHAKEVAEIKANTDRLLLEMQNSMDKERQRIINDTRKQCEMERIRSIEDAKRKQWCANCLKEAQFYCCWNTSYCNHVCQRKHWEQHMSTCAQVESTPNVPNSRKAMSRNAAKSDARTQPQTNTQHATKTQVLNQKDNLNAAVTVRPGGRTVNNTTVPALRNILPKNALASISQSRHTNQGVQTHGKPTANQQNSCIIVGRPLQNWASSSTKPASLLHSNTIFLPSNSQSYATITNVQSGTAAGVSLLNTAHSQVQKSNTSETIIIP